MPEFTKGKSTLIAPVERFYLTLKDYEPYVLYKKKTMANSMAWRVKSQKVCPPCEHSLRVVSPFNICHRLFPFLYSGSTLAVIYFEDLFGQCTVSSNLRINWSYRNTTPLQHAPTYLLIKCPNEHTHITRLLSTKQNSGRRQRINLYWVSVTRWPLFPITGHGASFSSKEDWTGDVNQRDAKLNDKWRHKTPERT